MDTLIIIGILLAIAATIVLYIKVMPKKYDGKLENKFLQFLHDFFHFKTFYIEALTKFVFVLLTCACIFVGFLLLFGKIEYYGYFGATFEQSTFLYGLGLMILGPLVLRVSHLRICHDGDTSCSERYRHKPQAESAGYPHLTCSCSKGRRSRRAGSSGERGGRSFGRISVLHINNKRQKRPQQRALLCSYRLSPRSETSSGIVNIESTVPTKIVSEASTPSRP